MPRKRPIPFRLAALALCAMASAASGQRTNDQRLCFVQISDTHFGETDAFARARKVIDRINGLPMPVACVVHTGDVTLNRIGVTSIVDRAVSLMRELRAPVRYVPGNHDITGKRFADTSRIFTERFGPLVDQAEYGGVVFVTAFVEPLARGSGIEGYDALRDLETCLRQAGGKPVLVFVHTPPVDDFYNNAMHEGWQRETRERFIRLVNAHNVKAVIAGHFHRDEFHWIGNVPLFCGPAVAGTWGRQATFRIYEYDNGRVTYRTQYVE